VGADQEDSKMKKIAVVSLVAAALGFAAPAAAGSVTSEIVAHDRVAHVIVLKDSSVLSYNAKTTMPDDLKQGDKVEVEFEGSEGDQSIIVSVQRVAQ
jgi:hypothetical protein